MQTMTEEKPGAPVARYMMVSADTHAGRRAGDYGPYLDSSFRDDFEQWLPEFGESIGRYHRSLYERVLRDVPEDVNAFRGQMDRGLDDPSTRLRNLEADGCVAAVVYPFTDQDTRPPFNNWA